MYRDYFHDFFIAQNQKTQMKIMKVLTIIEEIDRIPSNYLKKIENCNGLYEIRIQLANNIFRVFCCFDGENFVILLSGFQKKTQKTPKAEIIKAQKLMNLYYKEKEDKNEY